MDLAARAKSLGISQRKLSALTGFDENTVGRVLRSSESGLRSTYLKLQEAIEAAELDQLRHLAALHPDKIIELSTVALCPERKSAA